MSDIDTERFRELLVARWTELTGDVNGLHAETRASSGEVRMPTHMADLASNANVLEDNFVKMEAMNDEARRVKEAIDRIEAGTYGICPECDEHITPERLEALPHAELCIKCKQAQETGQQA